MNPFFQAQRRPPMSNAERQRQFRKRNPGYYGRLHRARNAAIDASLAARVALTTAPTAVPLALPAPAECFAFEDRATIPTPAELQREREAVLVPVPICPAA